MGHFIQDRRYHGRNVSAEEVDTERPLINIQPCHSFRTPTEDLTCFRNLDRSPAQRDEDRQVRGNRRADDAERKSSLYPFFFITRGVFCRLAYQQVARDRSSLKIKKKKFLAIKRDRQTEWERREKGDGIRGNHTAI